MTTYLGKFESELHTSTGPFYIKRCITHFTRHHNVHFPDSNPFCEMITLVIKVDQTYKMIIQDWYINQLFINCTISYNVVSEKEKLDYERCMELTEAQCVSMKEVYDNDTKNGLHEYRIEIVPASIKIYAKREVGDDSTSQNSDRSPFTIKANGESEFIHPSKL